MARSFPGFAVQNRDRITSRSHPLNPEPRHGPRSIERRCFMIRRAPALLVCALMADPAARRRKTPQFGNFTKQFFSALVLTGVVTPAPRGGRLEKFQAAGSGMII